MSDAPDLIVSKEVKEYKKYMGQVSPEKIVERVGKSFHPKQKEIAKYFEKPLLDTWDIMTLLISRRWGKTYLNQGIATSDLLTPNSKIMLVAFSSSLAELWFQDILSNLLKIKELDGKVKWEKKKGYIYIPELNTSLQVSSYLNFDTLGIGRQFCKIYIDEGFLIPIDYQEAIINMLMPTMSTYGSQEGIRNGKLIIISTPRGTATGSLFGRYFLSGMRGEKGFLSFTYDIYTSPFLTKEEIQHIKDNTPPEIWAQEYLCHFTKTTKTIMRNFDKDKHIIRLTDSQIRDMIHHCDVVVSMDFGIVDGSGHSVVLYNNKTETYYLIDEYYIQGQIAYDFINLTKNKMVDFAKKFDVPFESIIFLRDPANLDAGTMASRMFDLTIHKAKNNRTAGIDYVNQILQGKGENGVPRLFISDKCPIHISQMEYAEFKIVAGQVSNQFGKDHLLGSHFECLQTLIYATYTHNKTSHSSFIIS